MPDVEHYRERIRGEWDEDDPDVLLLGGEGEPVVADVDGELRTLSSKLLYAYPTAPDDLEAAIDRRGEPDVVPLSSQSHRFDREAFETLHPDDREETEVEG